MGNSMGSMMNRLVFQPPTPPSYTITKIVDSDVVPLNPRSHASSRTAQHCIADGCLPSSECLPTASVSPNGRLGGGRDYDDEDDNDEEGGGDDGENECDPRGEDDNFSMPPQTPPRLLDCDEADALDVSHLTDLETFRIKSYKISKKQQHTTTNSKYSKFVADYHENIVVVEVPKHPQSRLASASATQTSLGGSICSLFFTHPKSRGITILYSHGNAEDLGHIAPHLLDLSKFLCVNVVAYDYRGYGQSVFGSSPPSSSSSSSSLSSPPSPTEATVNEDLETMYAYVCLERQISPGGVFLYGRSLGSCPSAHLAAVLTSTAPTSRRVANFSSEGMLNMFQKIRKFSTKGSKSPMLGGLIIQSGMKSCLKTKFDLPFLNFPSADPHDTSSSSSFSDMFSTQSYIPYVESPIFIIHGSGDTIVPCEHGTFLFKLAVKARDARWALNEKKKSLKEKEQGVVMWLWEAKEKQKQKRAEAAAEREIAKFHDEASRSERPSVGMSFASHPADESLRIPPIETAKAKSAVTQPCSTTPAPIAMFLVKGAGHNDLNKVSGLSLVNKTREFLIEVLRFRPPEHQAPMMTSPPPPREPAARKQKVPISPGVCDRTEDVDPDPDPKVLQARTTQPPQPPPVAAPRAPTPVDPEEAEEEEENYYESDENYDEREQDGACDSGDESLVKENTTFTTAPESNNNSEYKIRAKQYEHQVLTPQKARAPLKPANNNVERSSKVHVNQLFPHNENSFVNIF